jgi:hypothetical protein
MLAVNSYRKDYVHQCRSQIESQLAAYNALINTANGKRSALESFEPLFFNNLVLVMDRSFVHRTRALEGKDVNPMNEVRMIWDSLLENSGKLTANKTIKYNPSKSVLKLDVDDEIKLNESRFIRLSNAFFAEIENKFT